MVWFYPMRVVPLVFASAYRPKKWQDYASFPPTSLIFHSAFVTDLV